LLAAGKAKDTTLCIVENASRTGRRLKHTLLEIAQQGLPALEGPVTLLLGQALRYAKAQDSGLGKQVNGQQADWSYGVA
jgi:siroheme synthase